MTFARRILLVGTDHRLGQEVQTHLHKTFLLSAPVVRPDDLPNLVTRDADGVLVFFAADAAGGERAVRAVRELRLQALPPRLALVTAPAAARVAEAARPHVEGVFAWGDDPRDLNAWLRRAATPGTPFADPANEAATDRVARKLVQLTPSLAAMADQLDIAAAHDVTVLIEGETGTGKTHLARLVHDCSARAPHRFLVVACGTLSGNLIASEFFGHVRGAFTGADSAKVGKFAAAGHGTILLDEIDTLGLDHQANLLRVIETGEFEPVGGNETQTCQARIIAATNWNLADAVERGTFRRDLYYRLNVLAFHLPPLRARPQDIGPLARGLAVKYAERFKKPIGHLDPAALRALEQFPWPGNIRQLENVMQQAVLACTGDAITPANLPGLVVARSPDGRVDPTAPPANSLAQNRETTERVAIVRALEKVAHSRTRAAQLLGVSRVTLYKKMKKYGLLTGHARVNPEARVASPE
jgi:transcriptional regulator with PAS, ATPase and Fis domain